MLTRKTGVRISVRVYQKASHIQVYNHQVCITCRLDDRYAVVLYLIMHFHLHQNLALLIQGKPSRDAYDASRPCLKVFIAAFDNQITA